ncbi:hypothetical protein SAMN05428975_4925 [Mucilaginibacter sp. OK268]|nr:hypothetical protein SAMN05428975_4925 [Mucilaginibacter sp. OK268]
MKKKLPFNQIYWELHVQPNNTTLNIIKQRNYYNGIKYVVPFYKCISPLKVKES